MTSKLETPSGIVVAIFLYPLTINLLKGGPPLMWQWIKAKFTNSASGGAGEGGGHSPREHVAADRGRR